MNLIDCFAPGLALEMLDGLPLGYKGEILLKNALLELGCKAKNLNGNTTNAKHADLLVEIGEAAHMVQVKTTKVGAKNPIASVSKSLVADGSAEWIAIVVIAADSMTAESMRFVHLSDFLSVAKVYPSAPSKHEIRHAAVGSIPTLTPDEWVAEADLRGAA